MDIKKLIFLLFLVITTGAVAETPADVVKTALDATKNSGSPAEMLNYIHWQTVFEKLPPEQRASFKATTPEELKRFYQKSFEDPTELIKSQLSRIPQDQRAAAEQQLGTYANMMKSALDQAKIKLKSLQYEITNSKINGNEAIVSLKTTTEGKVTNSEVKMLNVDGKWYFANINPVEKIN